MFTILYETSSGITATQALDSNNRTKLTRHLAGFQNRIVEVYEQATPITKAARKDLAGYAGAKSRHAAAFAANSPG